ncbi:MULTISPECIES: aldehyde dehydrogenase family protein [Mycobacterium]|uniref:Putative succinate-semialdehyde dehydrogenase [NADP(+)] 2 n=1 Tax=Mycobacterium paraintracellulare TaxID=1138383 RepID=A0ABN6AYD4_9MYCO|nr:MULTISPECIES: aldehyde dehydrogenase family protein [Mycobacterium]AFC54339.1 aldehyde dehydrogenase [Mycobacterium paraintracellulare]OSC28653.1 aldehyde dehydrogenase [Mycobacterium paraintracellulare]WSE53730.1 aldehyde dehydrogenase family protein [Mycobacterium sp. 2-64]BBY72509.1 aldehyde dehydrogenase [Mycobacterium paraintracellulare]BCO89605.1 aldehyde dehydrogenase [Mycobacterium paraintracellulare]
MTSSVDVERPKVELRIGAERLSTGSGGVRQHIDPTTGRPDADVPMAGPSEVDRAVRVAHAAYLNWRRTKPADRRQLLMRLADLIEARSEDFARMAALDNGTPIATSSVMLPVAVEWTRYYAGWADKLSSEVTATLRADGEFSYTLAQPWGVIGAIITWNGPLISLAMKVPAAIAAGNTVVIKPSELTPFTAGLFADVAADAGIPAGVINVVPGGAEAGAALVEHPLVKKISFTGGPETARKILRSCADQIKPAVMELGGKSGNIVFADADLDTACGIGTMMSVGILSGQGCAFPTRMIVERSIYDEVIERVKTIAGFLKVGHPFEADTISGPVVSQQALNRISGMVERAIADGARLVIGGGRLGGEFADGYFLEPTILADVDPQSELAQTEVFGPVLSMIPFDDEEHAIEIANGTPYGLSGYVFTNNLRRAHRVAEELDTGEVLINGAPNLGCTRPFGGIGISGMGKEGGRAGLEEFLHFKTVSMA